MTRISEVLLESQDAPPLLRAMAEEIVRIGQEIASLKEMTPTPDTDSAHPHDATCPGCASIYEEARSQLKDELDQAATREGLDEARDQLAAAYDRLTEGVAPPAPSLTIVGA